MITSILDTLLRRARHHRASIVAALLAVAAVMPASAQQSFTATHVAELNNGNEVPSTGLSGSGLAIFRYDLATDQLDYRITVTRLLSPITAAHFHSGKPGQTGSPIKTIEFPAGKSTVQGSWAMSPAEREMLLNGDIYVNVHTETAPSGHIRGQVMPIYNASAFGMSGQNEVPPAATSTGFGEGVFWVDYFNKSVAYHVKWQTLKGRPTGIQIALGKAGTTGPVVHTMPFSGTDSSASGVWMGISTQEMNALRVGDIYLNVLTDSFPEGEIRGKIVQVNTFTAAISATNELSPVTSSAAGTGILQLVEDPNAGGAFVLGSFIIDDFTGNVTVAHLHRGTATETGNPIYALNRQGGTFYTPPPGHIQLYGDDFVRFFDGAVYANFHTASYPDGEARGQLVPSFLNLGMVTAGVDRIDGSAPPRLEVRIDPAGTSAHLLLDPARIGSGDRVEIVSALGQRMMTVDADREHLVVPFDALAGGLYMARLVDDGGSTVAVGRIAVVR